MILISGMPGGTLAPDQLFSCETSGDPVDPTSVPPGKEDIASLLPRMGDPDSLVLCYTNFTMFDLPGIGPVVAMIGLPEDSGSRHYAMLVYEFVEFVF